MNKLNNEFFERDNEWLNEFNRCSVNWVDKELVRIIIESLNISQNQLMRFIGDSKKWISKITNKNFKIDYHYLRDAADFIGIPPWFLFYRNSIMNKSLEFNREIIDLFSNTPPNLPIFNITLKNQLSHVHRPYENKDEKKFNFDLRENFGHSSLAHHSFIEGDWMDIFDYLNDRFDEGGFSGSGIILSEDITRYIRLGTLRIRSFKPLEQTLLPTDREFLRRGIDYWTTSWLSVDLYLDEYENKKREIEVIVEDLSLFFGQYPWNFSIKREGKIKIIYSWHSLRKKEAEKYKVDIASIIEDKMKDSKSKLELSIASKPWEEQQSPMNNELEQLHSLFYNHAKECIKNDTGKKGFTRRQNTLPLLIEKNYLQEGSIVTLEHNVNKSSNYIDDVYFATIIIDNGVIKLKWHYDHQIYYISPLTEKIFNELSIKPTIKRKNGNFYWGLQEGNISFEEVVKQFLK